MALLPARSFVFALDGFDAHLRALEEELRKEGLEAKADEIAKVKERFQAAFPDANALRHTLHHMEDRIRGRGKVTGRRGKVVDISAPGGKFFDRFDGNVYRATVVKDTPTATLGGVDVSAASVEKLRAIAQDAIDAFEWVGNPQPYSG